MFAKLYDTLDHGQVLVTLEQAKDTECEAEVRIKFEVCDGAALVSMAVQFADDESGDGWDKAQAMFDATDINKAVNWTAGIKADLELK